MYFPLNNRTISVEWPVSPSARLTDPINLGGTGLLQSNLAGTLWGWSRGRLGGFDDQAEFRPAAAFAGALPKQSVADGYSTAEKGRPAADVFDDPERDRISGPGGSDGLGVLSGYEAQPGRAGAMRRRKLPENLSKSVIE